MPVGKNKKLKRILDRINRMDRIDACRINSRESLFVKRESKSLKSRRSYIVHRKTEKNIRQDQQARPGATPRWDAIYWKNQVWARDGQD